MKLKITGGTRYQQSQCRKFTHHTVKKICGTRLYNLLDVKMVLIPHMAADTGFIGSCIPTDPERYPREFEIELDSNLKPRYLLITLAHELVHLEQYARARLKQTDLGVYRWNKVVYDDVKEGWNSKYQRLPWEIEARGLEETLFDEWVEEANILEDWAYIDMFDYDLDYC